VVGLGGRDAVRPGQGHDVACSNGDPAVLDLPDLGPAGEVRLDVVRLLPGFLTVHP
jgi:hypothetical protein